MAEKKANTQEGVEKSETALREESVIPFWNEHKIFEKSLEKVASNGDFVFYDGPPFATGLPHSGSLLSSVIKDVVPRYKTMQGFYVRRRWGWDCHGLPIESLVEKELGLKSKKDIENLGVAKFNEAARSMVMKYAHDWERYVERIGRFVEFKNAYKTMDNTYIESVWWGLSEIHKKGRLYEGRKVLMYCPHCETPLAKAEIAMDNSYEDVTEEAVTVKFKVKNPEKFGLSSDTYLLAWTTTPWTLPGNVALAVGPEIKYGLFEKDGANYIAAMECAESLSLSSATKQLSCDELVGLDYEPLFEIEKVQAYDGKKWTVLPADFVTTEDGTGIVHTAVIYGEDDYQLGVKEKLPMVPLLNAGGKFNDDAPEFIRGKYLKYHTKGFPQAEKGQDAETFIKRDLESRGLIFERKNYTHSYPHCYRCGTPLIYNAITSWFIDIQSVKARMLEENEQKVNWVPEHLKRGRFQNIVENAPDWTISRNRYWASPLPIWRNAKGEITVIGSLEELRALTKKSGNTYRLMRHGEAESNAAGICTSEKDAHNPLTEKGKGEVEAAIQHLKSVDLIIASPFMRTKMTAEMVKDSLGVAADIVYDERLGEVGFGVLNGVSMSEYHEFLGNGDDWGNRAPEGGESWNAVKERVGAVLYEIESKYEGKNILIIAHNSPLRMLCAAAKGEALDGVFDHDEDGERFGNAEIRQLDFVPLPHNAKYELDLHRPYIDEIELVSDDGPLTRTIEVVDCWVESGSMPFAELHYPVENTELFKKRFPGDFIAEYIAQTRTWFYYMHAVALELFDSYAFKNVVSTGTILAADGSKMSKSKQNYTDPLVNIDRYGADAMRYYLMSSVVMQAEDLRFRDEDLRDAHNRVVNILWNSFKFYDLYKHELKAGTDPFSSENILDRWVLSRLAVLVRDVTDGMEKYDMVRATRPIAGFITDFSTWYIRRSRDRFKAAGEDQQMALSVAQHVFIELAKVIAPVMPFIAESIYRGAGGKMESVHLESWPEAGDIDEAVLESMKQVRDVVSMALEARNRAGIKVRQPLQKLSVRDFPEIVENAQFSELILDELNIKEVVHDAAIVDPILLDTTMSDALKREGAVRELARHIQDLRKAKGLAPQDLVDLNVKTDADGEALIREFEEELKKTVNTKSFSFGAASGEAFDANGFSFVIEIA